MPSPIRSIITAGPSGLVVEAECHLSNGLPAMVIVGLANKVIDEAKERIRSALHSSHIPLPRKRITINLAPADVHKDSTGLDLPIALAVLAYSGQLTVPITPYEAFMGELGLDGSLRPIRGLIGKLLAGKQRGMSIFYVPAGNLSQALLVPGITVIPLTHIRELYSALNNQGELIRHITGAGRAPQSASPFADVSLHSIAGQESAKRALVIAAAGGHNILLSGPPGTGKSLLANAVPSLLPALTVEEMLEITHLHSLVSTEYEQLVTVRPFRAPHHSASYRSLVGGGNPLRPGEITLAHRGVLFLDELPEFRRETLEALRQPLENQFITLNKTRQSATFAADFMLVATANPCPCGYAGTDKPCSCPPRNVQAYRAKLSGPLLDRIDLHVAVDNVAHQSLLNIPSGSDMRPKQLIIRARKAQLARFATSQLLNSRMTNRLVAEKAGLSGSAKQLIDLAAARLGLSARSYMRVIKVARTIADVESAQSIQTAHMSEALRYRPTDPG